MSGKAIRETLGFLAVVASMIFVGLEIQQNTVAQRAETRQGLADASRDMSLAIATNPELNRVWYAMWQPYLDDGRAAARLTFSDTLVARSSMFTNLRNVENVFLQMLEGVIDESVLNTYNFNSPTYDAPFFALYWEATRSSFDSRFVEAFEEANGLR